MSPKRRKIAEEPAMSDALLLLQVEDLISIAMGPPTKNFVNFKMLQTVLLILARHMRVLDQKVELQLELLDDLENMSPEERAKYEKEQIGEDDEDEDSDEDESEEGDGKGGEGEEGKADGQKKRKGKGRKGTGAFKYQTSESFRPGDELDQKGGEDDDSTEGIGGKRARKGEDDDDEGLGADADKTGKGGPGKKGAKGRAGGKKGDKSGESEKEGSAGGKKGKGAKGGTEGDEEDGEKGEGGEGGTEGETGGKKGKGAKGGKGREGETKGGKKGEKSTGSDISITETMRGDEKVLVVGQGKGGKRGSRGSRGSSTSSIDVVTMTMFRELQKVVDELKGKAEPLPAPTMPDNAKLREDLAKGSASLQDTMKAMQVTSRMDAAEKAVDTLTALLTSLAANGYLPEDIAGKVAALTKGPDGVGGGTGVAGAGGKQAAAGKKAGGGAASDITEGVATGAGAKDPTSKKGKEGKDGAATADKGGLQRQTSHAKFQGSATGLGQRSVSTHHPGSKSGKPHGDTERFATPHELEIAIDNVKQMLLQDMKNVTGKSVHMAETAFQTAKALNENMGIILSTNRRIDEVLTALEDYNSQLDGFDIGVKTQISSFLEQMNQMRKELADGMRVLDDANNTNNETAAVMEIREKNETLNFEFDQMTHNYNDLAHRHRLLLEDLNDLMMAAEGLGEQKADREEVADGLKDKADNSRLEGLMTEKKFSKIQKDLEKRIDVCYDKFDAHDAIWIEALKQIGEVVRGKAAHAQLVTFRDDMEEQLRVTHRRLQLLTRIMGEPKAAILNREVSRDGRCAACGARATQEHKSHAGPPRLPALAKEEPDLRMNEDLLCLREYIAADDEPPEGRRQPHACHRWTGGSHTIVTDRVNWERATEDIKLPPVKKVIGLGIDGKSYKLEKQLLPCVECNQLLADRYDKKYDGKQVKLGITDEDGDRQDNRRSSRQERLPKSSLAKGAIMSSTLIIKDQMILPKALVVEIDATPAREGEIGHLVEGVALVVDEPKARRASIKYDMKLDAAAAARGEIIAEEITDVV